MAKANINDRASIERLYPPDTFARDAANNDATAPVLAGLRVASAPDEAGAFDLEPARQQVGEAGQAAFLAPRRRSEEIVGQARYGGGRQVAEADPEAGYRAFIDDVIAAARECGFERERAPGPSDARLRGLRQ